MIYQDNIRLYKSNEVWHLCKRAILWPTDIVYLIWTHHLNSSFAKPEKLTFMGPHLNNRLMANEIKPGRWQHFGAKTDFKEQTNNW